MVRIQPSAPPCVLPLCQHFHNSYQICPDRWRLTLGTICVPSLGFFPCAFNVSSKFGIGTAAPLAPSATGSPPAPVWSFETFVQYRDQNGSGSIVKNLRVSQPLPPLNRDLPESCWKLRLGFIADVSDFGHSRRKVVAANAVRFIRGFIV